MTAGKRALFCALLAVPAAGLAAAEAVVERLGVMPADTAGDVKEVWIDHGRHVVWIERAPDRCRVWLDGRPDPECGAFLGGLAVSPDGRRAAYKVPAGDDGKKRAVMADGRRGPVFDQVNNDSIAFTADNRLIYTASRAERTIVMVETNVFLEGPELRGPPHWTPDLAHVAVKVVARGNPERRAVMLDGRQGPVFDQIMPGLLFSPDGAHLAYIAQNGPGSDSFNGKEWFAVLDGAAGPAFNRIEAMSFTPDGRHLGYIGIRDGRACWVLDQQAGEAFDEIDPFFLRWSHDGRHMGFRARRGDRWLLVLDGQAGTAHDGILDWTFAPGGERHAAITRHRNGRWRVTEGEHSSPDYDGVVGPLAFSADGRHLACRARRGNAWHVVLDGRTGPAWDLLLAPRFAPAGDAMAHVGSRGGRWFVVVNGRRQGPFDWFDYRGPWFSPDGRRVAFAARKNNQWRVHLDGREGPSCEALGAVAVCFSPDSRHTAGMCLRAGRWRVAVDGTEGPACDRLIGDELRWNGNDGVEYLAMINGHLARVRQPAE